MCCVLIVLCVYVLYYHGRPTLFRYAVYCLKLHHTCAMYVHASHHTYVVFFVTLYHTNVNVLFVLYYNMQMDWSFFYITTC